MHLIPLRSNNRTLAERNGAPAPRGGSPHLPRLSQLNAALGVAGLLALGVAVFSFFAVVAAALCDTGNCPSDETTLMFKVLMGAARALVV